MNAGETQQQGIESIAEAVARLGERKYTWPVLCERAAVEHEIADQLWRALGFPDVPPDEPAYTDEDVKALRFAAEGLSEVSGAEREQALEVVVREARTVSGHLARIAEQQVDALAEFQALGLRRSSVTKTLEDGIERSPLGWLLLYALRRRLDEAIRRRGTTEAGAEPRLVVGFIDLVNFTRASTGLDAATFGRVLGRFEALVWDEITEAGGRLVKLVGDEAMFVSSPAEATAEALAAILGKCGRDDLPDARAGVAAGPVLMRGGDYFGPVVNLASRLTDVAPPGAIAMDDAFRGVLSGQGRELVIEQAAPQELKGIGATNVWLLNPQRARTAT